MNKLKEDPIASIVLLLGFTYLFCERFLAAKPDNGGITIAVTGMMMLVLNYLYGSSKGSVKKDETISNVISNNSEIKKD